MKRSLVIGKFYPPHKGHHYLIETALSESDHLDLLVCDSPSYTISAEKRAAWLRQMHPTANVQIIQDIDDDDNSERWAKHTIEFLGYAPDVVFTSETYGDPYAQFMGCEHRLVDLQRTTVPICATKVRQDPIKTWHFMKPTVRAHFCHRICVLGAESTGTTTLSMALAKHYNVPWVPEIGRYYTESIKESPHVWQDVDFTHIATLQQEYEDIMAGLSSGLLICDTNAFATKIWQERYVGSVTPEMEILANKACADLYIVTGDEIPFVQDGIRDGEAIRHDMHRQFVEELTAQGLPFKVIRGSLKQRIETATKYIDTITAKVRTV